MKKKTAITHIHCKIKIKFYQNDREELNINLYNTVKKLKKKITYKFILTYNINT